MKKKSFALILAMLMLFGCVAYAYAWESPVYLDPFNNPLFTVVEELGSDYEVIAPIYDGRYERELYPHYYGKENFYNDGLTRKMYDYLPDGFDSTYEISGLFDMEGDVVYTPGDKEIAAMSFDYGYNLGYVMEREVSFNDIQPKVYTTYINVVTGEQFCFDTIDSEIFGNDGMMIFNIGENYYKAKLNNPPMVTVHLNGQKLYFDQVPVIEEGRTLVPVRGIFEALGAEVSWDGENRMVTATKGDITVSLGIDQTVATKNGETITLDVPARIISGRTLVPARFVADCFGVDVEWNSEMRQVLLTGSVQ